MLSAQLLAKFACMISDSQPEVDRPTVEES